MSGMLSDLIPKSFHALKNYSWEFFRRDLLAGVTVGMISLPLAMAFAIASGTTPEKGLYTAIVAGFLISALGGSRVQIGGPTGAFVMVIFDCITRNGYEGLLISTTIAAVLLVLAGLFRLGSLIRYVPHPLVTGFTTGIAVIVFSSQLKEFFGLKMNHVPAEFGAKWLAYIQHLPTTDATTFLLSLGLLFLIIGFRRFVPKFPWGIAAIVTATLVVWLFDLPVATIATQFGKLPSALPVPHLPSFHIPEGKLWTLFADGVVIAFLAGVESLLSAVIGDAMCNGKHKPNAELVGQGVANFASVLFGGIPATGAIARTAANVRTGAKTPLAGMIHAVVLFLIIWGASPLASRIPMSALAAILVMVAWNMSELPHFIALLRAPGGDVAVMLTAFFLTIFVDLPAAVIVGMILAAFVFMQRMSRHSRIVVEGKTYEMQGPLFFGATHVFKNLFETKAPEELILKMNQVSLIDASGLHALKDFARLCKEKNVKLVLSGMQPHVAKAVAAAHIVE